MRANGRIDAHGPAKRHAVVKRVSHAVEPLEFKQGRGA